MLRVELIKNFLALGVGSFHFPIEISPVRIFLNLLDSEMQQ